MRSKNAFPPLRPSPHEAPSTNLRLPLRLKNARARHGGNDGNRQRTAIPHIPTARRRRLYNDIFALHSERHYRFAPTKSRGSLSDADGYCFPFNNLRCQFAHICEGLDEPRFPCSDAVRVASWNGSAGETGAQFATRNTRERIFHVAGRRGPQRQCEAVEVGLRTDRQRHPRRLQAQFTVSWASISTEKE